MVPREGSFLSKDLSWRTEWVDLFQEDLEVHDALEVQDDLNWEDKIQAQQERIKQLEGKLVDSLAGQQRMLEIVQASFDKGKKGGSVKGKATQTLETWKPPMKGKLPKMRPGRNPSRPS